MAESKNNIITHGLSGKVGNLIDNKDLSGDKITIQATDIPDNLSEKIQTL